MAYQSTQLTQKLGVNVNKAAGSYGSDWGRRRAGQEEESWGNELKGAWK